MSEKQILLVHVGDWVVAKIHEYGGGHRFVCVQADRVTPKLIYHKCAGIYGTTVRREAIVASLSRKVAAEHLLQALNGVRGTASAEQDRERKRHRERIDEIWSKADRQYERLVAKAIEPKS